MQGQRKQDLESNKNSLQMLNKQFLKKSLNPQN